MPGLFGDSNGSGLPGYGLLGAFGLPSPGIASSVDPQLQELQYRRGAYNALSQQNGPQDAAILMGNPPAYGLGFQRQLFLDQLKSLMGTDPNNPKMSLSEALYKISPEGQKQQYGITPVPGYEVGDIKAPGVISGGRLQPPTGFANGASGVPGQPAQGPGSLPPMAQTAIEMKRQEEAAKALGTAQGTAQGGLPNTQALLDKSISDVQSLINDPNLKYATGMYGELYGHIPGSPAQAPMASLKQLHGESALTGLQYLQKIGRLNINEFNAGANAIGRLNVDEMGKTPQKYQDAVNALRDLKKVFETARSRSGETAGVGPTPAPVQSQPSQQPPKAGSFNQDELLAEARRRSLIK